MSDPLTGPGALDHRPGAFASVHMAAMRGQLARNWWLLALRGLLAIAFGLVAFLMPSAAILSILFVFIAYALVDGAFSVFAAVKAARDRRPWKATALEGATSILFAVLAMLWPGLTVFVFVLLVGGWAIVSGGMMLRSAYGLDAAQGRWWLVFSGMMSVVFGLLLLLAPPLGALVLTWWVAAFATLLGFALLVLAFKLRAADLGGSSGAAAA